VVQDKDTVSVELKNLVLRKVANLLPDRTAIIFSRKFLLSGVSN
jgi:hypothetical protein